VISREVWYRRPDVLFQLVGACRDREVSFIGDGVGAVRCVFAQNSGVLRRNFDAFRFVGRPFNMYYSLARVRGIRMFSFNPVARKQEYRVWNAGFMEHIAGFDLGLDFDAPDVSRWDVAWNDCRVVKSLLDEFKVPYTLKFSGGGGFHIRVPFAFLKDFVVLAEDEEDVRTADFYYKMVGESLKERFSLDSLDIGVFDFRRLWKVDYSLAEPYGLVALPLSDEQFIDFGLSLVEPESVLKAGLYNRGLLLRPGGADGVLRLLEFLGLEGKE
jgi:hypothetical protein